MKKHRYPLNLVLSVFLLYTDLAGAIYYWGFTSFPIHLGHLLGEKDSNGHQIQTHIEYA